METLVNTITILEERNKSFSLWKCKELPSRTITSITFPLLNEKLFSFDSTSSTTNIRPTLTNTKEAFKYSRIKHCLSPRGKVEVSKTVAPTVNINSLYCFTQSPSFWPLITPLIQISFSSHPSAARSFYFTTLGVCERDTLGKRLHQHNYTTQWKT